MRRFITSTLAAACLACWAANAIAQSGTGGQPIPKFFTADDAPQASSPGWGQPAQILTPDNQAPVVTIAGPSSGSSFPIDSLIQLSGSFTDEAGDTHTAQWSFGTITAAGTVSEAGRTVGGGCAFSAPGIYYVTLTVTDQAGHSGTASRVNGQDAVIVIYDRGYGFVDGKGRFDSPAGAYAANPLLTGRMDFDFDARYRKDDPVPTGTTQFKLSVGSLDFEAIACDWFNCSGARAVYKGTGTVNGTAGYAFLISAVDGDDIGGGAVDRLRIKITQQASGALVYDNQMGAPDSAMATCPISGGDVNVRLPNGGIGHLAAFQPVVEQATPGPARGFDLAQNFPNPFRASTEVRFSLPQRSSVKIAVFDVAGREVASLADGAWDAGSHSVSWAGRTDSGSPARGGVYFVRLAVGAAGGEGSHVAIRKMILQD
jgi:hypothetical protein